jgi:hypothetical protein
VDNKFAINNFMKLIKYFKFFKAINLFKRPIYLKYENFLTKNSATVSDIDMLHCQLHQ